MIEPEAARQIRESESNESLTLLFGWFEGPTLDEEAMKLPPRERLAALTRLLDRDKARVLAALGDAQVVNFGSLPAIAVTQSGDAWRSFVERHKDLLESPDFALSSNRELKAI